MKIPRNVSLALLTGAACMTSATIHLAHAETVATAPVGAVTKVIPTGLTPIGLPLLEVAAATGNCSNNTSTSVTIGSISNIGATLVASEPYYLEVTAGALEGERFDIDVAATIASANSVATLNASSPNNTLNLPEGSLIGCSVVIRRHITLERVASLFSPALTGNNNPALADQILLYNRNTNAFIGYYLRGDNSTWRQVGSTASVGKVVFIAPGTGAFVQRRGSGTQMTLLGQVRTNDFTLPMNVGNSFLAPPYPVGISPAGIGGTIANGWTGNNNSSLADQIQIYTASTNSFIGYYLRGDGTTWRQTGSTNVVTTTQLAGPDDAFFVVRKTNDSDYVLNRPFSL